MKKMIILILLFIITNLYSQDKEASKMIFHIYGKDTTLSREFVDGGKPRFTIGSQWGSLPKVHEALLMNMQENYYTALPTWDSLGRIGNFGYGYKTTTDTNKILATGYMDNSFKLSAASFQYEPTLKTDSLNNYQPRKYDNTNPIFGFKNIETTNFGYITPDNPDSASNVNYGRYQLKKNNSFGNIDSIVLYPNPVTKELTISLNEINNTQINYRIINNIGQELVNGNTFLQNNMLNVNVSSLLIGSYILNLQFNNSVKSFNFIIQ